MVGAASRAVVQTLWLAPPLEDRAAVTSAAAQFVEELVSWADQPCEIFIVLAANDAARRAVEGVMHLWDGSRATQEVDPERAADTGAPPVGFPVIVDVLAMSPASVRGGAHLAVLTATKGA